jgi:ArsR family transcriptional regulator
MNQKNIAEAFKVLGGSERIKIIRLLSSGEKCVCVIFKQVKLSQNLVSYHLSALRKNHLILARREGKRVYYSLNKKSFGELYEFLENIIKNEETK